MKNWESTKEFLLNIPSPSATRSYAPIPHDVFINELQEEIKKQGYNIVDERYLSASKGDILTGIFRLDGNGNGGSILSPAIGFTNSYNKMRKASLAAMAMVLICKNGMMANRGTANYSRKHSGTALEDIRAKIIEVVSGVEEQYTKLAINVEEMQNIPTDSTMLAKLVGDMFVNENLLLPTQLGILNREIHNSDNFKEPTLWSFYNNVTEALKDNHPMNYDKQMIKFHTYMSDKFNLTGSNGLYKAGVQFV